jgi:hypothetical protein
MQPLLWRFIPFHRHFPHLLEIASILAPGRRATELFDDVADR